MGRILKARHLALNIDGRQISVMRGDELPANVPDDMVQRLDAAGALEPLPGADVAGSGYESMTVDDLHEMADTRGLTVDGTGANGNVLKSDLVAALEADDRAGG